ncbi:terminase large subunit [bacterium]|nr:terminase large subunit [bacterium]
MELSSQAIQFIENLTLVGDHAGQPFILRDWQKQILKALFKTKNNQRIVSKFFLLLPRKNGKSQIAAAICLFSMLCLGHNQQILSAAATQEQASRIFDAMCDMIRADETLSKLCEIIPSKSRIVCEATNSFYCAVTSGGDALHGYSPTLVVLDELHAFTQPKHRRLHAALTTGFGARSNPLTILISTQTADRSSIAHEEFDYARKLKGRIENGKVKKSGTVSNEKYLSVLYYANEKQDWTNKNLWKQVNPALNDFLHESFLEDEFKIAQQIPSRANYFKQWYLNVPIDSLGKWMDMSLWDRCKDKSPDLTQYKCWGGLDLAPVCDLSAFVLLFDVDGVYHVQPYFWCPAADIMERSKVEQVPYDHWRDKGYIRVCSGNSTDFKQIRNDIRDICEKYRVQKIGADRSHAYDVAQGLIEDGIEVEWFRPGFESMGRPTARLEKLVIDGEIVHSGNPVMDYCVSNVVCESDAAENIRPSNKLRRKQDKIDGAVALIIALGMAIWDERTEYESVYSSDCSIWL